MSSVDELDGQVWFWFLSSHPANFTTVEVRRLLELLPLSIDYIFPCSRERPYP